MCGYPECERLDVITRHTPYFPCYCDQIRDKKQLKEEGFALTYGLSTVHCGGDGRAARMA